MEFSIDGPGAIAGVDNANPKDSDAYVGTFRKGWHGRALVVIKSGRKTGKVTLTANSPGLTTASITINVQDQQ